MVESPAKAKTINKYLGSNYKVLASYGHVRDLATTKKKGEEVQGIRIGEGWKLRYVVDDGSDDDGPKGRRRKSPKDILAEIKTEADRANRVLLASDPDREGESIAWHIADELQLDPARTFRVRFNEITPNAIRQAMAAADRIDMQRVSAQEARRAMDRVVGFPLSNLLGKKVGGGLSAGRVQSVAVKLVVDREREIEAFTTEEYWKITALLAPQGRVPFTFKPFSVVLAKAKKAGEGADRTDGEPGAELYTSFGRKPRFGGGGKRRWAVPTGRLPVPRQRTGGAWDREESKYNPKRRRAALQGTSASQSLAGTSLQAANAQLAGSVLLTRNGYGALSYFRSLCVRLAVDAYLTQLAVPAHGTVCESDYPA